MQWIKDQLFVVYGLVVVAGALFVGGMFGHVFGGIGDRLFGKNEEDA